MASTFIQRTTGDFIKLLMYFLVCGKCLPPILQTISTLRPLPPFWNYKHLDPLVASLDLYSVCIRKYILLGGSPRLHMPFYFTAKASYSFQTWFCHGHHLRRDEIKVFFLFQSIIIYVPMPKLKQFQKIQIRLVRELEKKFSGKHVVFVGDRKILPKPSHKTRVANKQKRPRSRYSYH